MIEVIERPIIFSAPMVMAILDGSKTQTRRVIKRIGGIGPVTEFQRSDTPGYDWAMRDKCMRWHEFTNAELLKRCIYGTRGSRLWVRETWQCFRRTSYEYDEWEEMESTKDIGTYGLPEVGSVVYKADNKSLLNKWFPSIHMPRWASRISLEVAGIRVERLHDIAEDDAVAEGVKITDEYTGCADDINPYKHAWSSVYESIYRSVYESINGKGSWDLNPFVWVIDFRKI